MRLSQIVVLAALLIGVATYVGIRVVREMRADEEFYGTLLDRLSDVLSAKGFTLTGPLVFPRVSGLHSATFEGPASLIHLIWDSREREIRLQHRAVGQEGTQAGQTLAISQVPNRASRTDYSAAAEAILKGVESIEGAA